VVETSFNTFFYRAVNTNNQEGKALSNFVWMEDEIGLLLQVTRDYKAAKCQETWTGSQVKYSCIPIEPRLNTHDTTVFTTLRFCILDEDDNRFVFKNVHFKTSSVCIFTPQNAVVV